MTGDVTLETVTAMNAPRQAAAKADPADEDGGGSRLTLPNAQEV